MSRMRSPSYPSISLDQAIDMVGKIHRSCRSNIITRENAAHEMGYSGLTGRSLKVLAALIQFGLLERTGKGDVRVTSRAVDILHAIDPNDQQEAILEAAFAPQLFKDIHERFPDGIPSQNAIRSFLIKEDFQDAAIGPAITAFMETYRTVEHIRESKSHSSAAEEGSGSAVSIKPDDATMHHQVTQPAPGDPPSTSAPTVAEAVGRGSAARELIPNEVYLDIRGSREVHVEGILDYDGILDLEEKLKALKMILKRPRVAATPDDFESLLSDDEKTD